MTIHERIRQHLIEKLALNFEHGAELQDEIRSEQQYAGSSRPDREDERMFAELAAEEAQLERKLSLVERYLAQHRVDTECGCRGVL